MKKIVILFLFFLSLLMVGCFGKVVSTNVNSVIDPELVTAKYDTILVWSALEKVQARSLVETSMVDALKEEGIKAYRSIDLFPPTKEYTREEVQNTVSKKNIPAVMFITITNIWETQKTYTTPKSGKITGSGNTLYYNEYGGQTYSHKKPNADIEFKILDIKHMAYSWIGEVTAVGNEYSGMEGILFKASEGITEKLKEDGKI